MYLSKLLEYQTNFKKYLYKSQNVFLLQATALRNYKNFKRIKNDDKAESEIA